MPAAHPVPPPDPRAAALAARAAGDHAAALALFRAAAAGGDRWSRNDAALEHLALGRTAQAQAEAAALVEALDDFAPAHRTLALVARREGRRADALRHFEAAAARDRTDLWNRQDAATELAALGRHEEAEAALRALARATPMPHAVRGLGLAARARGDHEAALAAFRVAADLLPGDPWFALDIAETLAALARAGEADAALARLAEAHPAFGEVWRRRARLAKARGDGAAELAHWRMLAATGGGDGDGALDLAEALIEHGEIAEAETLAVRRLAAGGAQARALRLLARAARRRGDAALAHAHARALCRMSPADASAHAELAADALALGHTEEARRQALAALALDGACAPA
ncbi:MAG: tetratricopeptide repeat protein, partial [Methylobacterium sp.]